ncbi:MAG: hypothetical protein ACRBN8_08145 [Nannocystales bacterium]
MGRVDAYARFDSGVITYSESFRCASCGGAWEADGDSTPEVFVTAIMKGSGWWGLSLTEPPRPLKPTVAVLRAHLGFDRLSALRTAKRPARGAPLVEGIRPQIEDLADVFQAAGVACQIKEVVGSEAPSGHEPAGYIPKS